MNQCKLIKVVDNEKNNSIIGFKFTYGGIMKSLFDNSSISIINKFYECYCDIHNSLFCHNIFVWVDNDKLTFRKQ